MLLRITLKLDVVVEKFDKLCSVPKSQEEAMVSKPDEKELSPKCSSVQAPLSG